MNPDTTQIDTELKEWRETQLKMYPTLSKRFRKNTKRTIEDDKNFIRIATLVCYSFEYGWIQSMQTALLLLLNLV